MRKTLLNALKHGSGTILSLFLLFCASQGVWAADARGTTLYLVPNAAWKDANAEFCLYYFNNADNSQDGWVSMTEVGSGSGVYEASVPEVAFVCDKLVFVRKNPNVSGCSWSSRWNQTGNLDYLDDKNVFEITGGSNNSYTGSWSYGRRFSADERVYLLNTAAFYLNGSPGSSNQLWYQNTQAGHGGTAWIHLWCGSSGSYGLKDIKFALLSGEAESDGAIYYVEVGEGVYTNFLITRNCSSSTGPWAPEGCLWNQSANFSIPPTNNRITGTTTSTYSSDYYDPCNNPTVTAGSYSDLTSSSVTIAATVTAAESDPCELSKVGVDVYTDQACTVSASVNKEVSYVGSDYTIEDVNVSSLTPKTTYYYKTYAKRSSDNAKVYSSNIGSFVMPCLSGVNEATLTSTVETVCLGSATALGVAGSGVVGGVYTYQWYYNSSASTSGAIAIPGATSNSYTPAVVGANYYYCGIAADGGYCEVPSQFSKLVTIKGVPVITASASSVTNYVPVTLTASGVESTSWSITSGVGGYLYGTDATTTKFKGNVGSSSTPVTYTIQASSDGCTGTASVTVSYNVDSCM